MTYTEAQVIAIGGTLWERNGKRRTYLNDVTAIYRAGYRAAAAERAARIGGTVDTPGNNRLRQVSGAVRAVYLDCASGRIVIQSYVIQSYGEDYDGIIADGIRILAGEQEPEQDADDAEPQPEGTAAAEIEESDSAETGAALSMAAPYGWATPELLRKVRRSGNRPGLDQTLDYPDDLARNEPGDWAEEAAGELVSRKGGAPREVVGVAIEAWDQGLITREQTRAIEAANGMARTTPSMFKGLR